MSARTDALSAQRAAIISRMANTTHIYRRATTDGVKTVTIMAYIGADTGDKDEIRRIIEHDGAIIEDGIAYFGTAGRQWLDEQHSTYLTEGFQADPG